MNLLLAFALSAVLVAPVRPASVEPDSGSVALTRAGEWIPSLSVEDALTILMSEHRLSLPIRILDDSDHDQPNIIPAGQGSADLRPGLPRPSQDLPPTRQASLDPR